MASITVHGQEMDEGLEEMWNASTHGISSINPATENWKIQTLPLARIKKIMKSEEFILQELEKEKQQKAAEEGQQGDLDKPILKFMISGEAPVLMSKACELLIKDLSFRAWRHTERNRRRTLQRQDLHAAVGESEVYDFLIDIVPRVTTPKTSVPTPTDAAAAAAMAPPMASGIPMAGIPSALPPVAGPMASAPPVAPPMQAMMDSSAMQQHHHQQTQQQQAQPGMVQHQYGDPAQQQQYQNYMAMPGVPTADMGQATNQMVVPTMAVGQGAPQWQAQPVPNSGGTQQNS